MDDEEMQELSDNFMHQMMVLLEIRQSLHDLYATNHPDDQASFRITEDLLDKLEVLLINGLNTENTKFSVQWRQVVLSGIIMKLHKKKKEKGKEARIRLLFLEV